ncbi:hypothetical protein AX17_003810 [Amanita inopinata Kibby_2008]|nr:hypothetical protein AX17_003810 [Amanita inopinata Kibby_2008]
MFSSLTSFLPSVLRDSTRNSSFSPDIEEAHNEEPPPPPGPSLEEQPTRSPPRKRGRERRNINETFVIVRPPPSKSNHPLNLQVQLVPPSSRSVLPRQSIEFDSAPSASLTRTTSGRSETSYSTASTASFASSSSTSTASTSTSTSSGRRAIVPLYNLQAHNVMTNVIVDAGTDAKIAKFQKRGIELIDLAVLEPIEVWPDPTAVVQPVVPVAPNGLSIPVSTTGAGASTSTLGRLSVDEVGFTQVPTRAGAISGRSVAAFLAPATTGSTSSRPNTPDSHLPNTAASSTASLTSSSHLGSQPRYTTSPEPQPTLPTSATLPQSNSKRKIFGKIFNKKSKEASTPSVSPLIPSSSPTRDTSLRRSISHQRAPIVTPPSQQATPKPRSDAQMHWPQYSETSHDASDASGTPTQMQPAATPTMQQYSQLGTNGPGSGKSHPSGLRSSWLGPPVSQQQQQQSPSSPLAAAFSSLGIKRRSAVSSLGTEGTNAIRETEQDGDHNPPHLLATVSGSSQSQPQPQLCPAVLGIQPTLCVVPTTAISSNGPSPRASGGEASGSVERGSAGVTGGPVKSVKYKEKVGTKSSRCQRPHMYVWLVRKWYKRRPPPPPTTTTPGGDEDQRGFGLGLHLGGVGPAIGLDTSWIPGGRDRELGVEEMVEVRFEWRRAAAVAAARRRAAAGVGGGEGGELVTSPTAEGHREPVEGMVKRGRRSRERGVEGEEKEERREAPSFDPENDERVRRLSAASIASARVAVKRWSLLSHHSQSTAGGASEEGEGEGDAGDESDPEDSETPWICTLKIRRTSAAAAAALSGNEASDMPGTNSARRVSTLVPSSGRESRGRRVKEDGPEHEDGRGKSQERTRQSEVLRIKVGTLSPTPHHPKVVAMLKVPFPLPDVQVERLGVVKRRGLGKFFLFADLVLWFLMRLWLQLRRQRRVGIIGD